MGIKQDIETSLKDHFFTKIDGQPKDEDVTNLIRKLSEMQASVPTTNRGGSHGHIGMIIEDAEYRTFSTGNVSFVIPTNPGPYPVTVDPDAAIREQQVADHKSEKDEFETYLGVLNAARKHIVRVIDPEWLEAIRTPTLGFAHLTLHQMIDHLRDTGGDLDYMDVSDLVTELTKQWEVSENPATKFARDDKYERQLIKLAYQTNRHFDFLSHNPHLRRRRNKGNRSTAKAVGFGIANATTATKRTAEEQAEEMAWAIAEVANALTAAQKKEFEQLTAMFGQLMQKMGTPTPQNAGDSAATSNFSTNTTNLALTGTSDKRLAVADGHIIEATHTAKLPLPSLADAARTTTVVPELAKSLLSVGVPADNSYTTIFRPYGHGAEVYANNACSITSSQPPVLRGCQDDNGLWVVPLEHDKSETACLDLATKKQSKPPRAHHNFAANVYELPSSQEVVWFLHAALGFPTKQTLLAAIRNNQLMPFPGLTAEAVAKHFPESDKTQKGHMRQTRCNSSGLPGPHARHQRYDQQQEHTACRSTALHARFLAPQHKIVVESPHAPAPRVEPTAHPIQQRAREEQIEHPTSQLPRVHHNHTNNAAVPTPAPTIIIPRPSHIPSAPPTIRQPPENDTHSIAARVRSRRCATAVPAAPKTGSIADRVKRRRREMAAPVLDHTTGQLLEYRALLRHPRFKDAWTLAGANEFDRLVQGKTGRVMGKNTIEFIRKEDVPQDHIKDVTYFKFICQVRTEKKEPNGTRATLGGNLINYPDDVGTLNADLLLIKIFFNSVISTPGACFANADISNFYLMTPLKRPEFARVRLTDIPDEIIQLYSLDKVATPDGWVYVRVSKGMYGLPQSGSLGHDLLEECLNQEGYFQSRNVPGLWRHNTRKIQVVLVVDDFGIKYIHKQDLDQLIDSLKKYYDVAVDMEGKEYVKIELDWDYANGKVHLLEALRQFDNVIPTKRHDSPHPHVPPKYGEKQQFAEYDTSPAVGKDAQKHVQTRNKQCGTQKKILDYCATQDPAVVTYRKSDMILAADSDAGYLNASNARSCAGGHHFLSEHETFPPHNGAIHNVAEIIKAVMSSAAEAELGALYINARKAVEERQILEEMGHQQPPTPMQTDTSTGEGIINARVQPKRTKAMDMRFHWLRDRGVNQKQFRFYWRPGPLNLADYFTKHHPPAHHRNVRPEFISPYSVVEKLRLRLFTSTARVCLSN
eukprot:CCRYP_021007-RA/>CCRYP_021007-RA protein AED:0.15 eAED:0.15 QI:0/0/0/1/1/1/5/0/1206